MVGPLQSMLRRLENVSFALGQERWPGYWIGLVVFATKVGRSLDSAMVTKERRRDGDLF